MGAQDEQKTSAETIGQFTKLLAQMNDIHNELRAGNVSDRERIRFIGDALFQIHPMLDRLRGHAASGVGLSGVESPLATTFNGNTQAMSARAVSNTGGNFTKDYTDEARGSILSKQDFGSSQPAGHGNVGRPSDLTPSNASLHLLGAYTPFLLEELVRQSGKQGKECELELLESAYAIEAQRFAQEQMADRYHKSAILLVKSALPHGGDGEMSDWYAEKQLEAMVKHGVGHVWETAFKLWGSKAKHTPEPRAKVKGDAESMGDGRAARPAAIKKPSTASTKTSAEKRKRVQFNEDAEVQTFVKPKKRYNTRRGSEESG